VNTWRKEHAHEEAPLSVSERARLRELEREVRELRMHNDFFKKGVPRAREVA
jgi:transposase